MSSDKQLKSIFMYDITIIYIKKYNYDIISNKKQTMNERA